MATVKDSFANPTPGITVRFSVSGANSPPPGSDPTDSNGEATFCYTGTVAGSDTIGAFADTDGSGGQNGTEPSDQASKTYEPADPATLALSPESASNEVDSQHCVSAAVEDSFANPTPNVTVRFSVSGSTSTSGSDTTDSVGEASFCYTGPALPGSDAISAFADSDGSGAQNGSEPGNTAAKTWTLPGGTPCTVKITNGGWFVADNADRASFGGVAKETSTGATSGQENFQDHGPAEPMHVKSIQIQAVTCSLDFTKASVFGKATINGFGVHDFRIDVQDLAEPGRLADTYRMRLSTGYDSGEHKLRGGNVQIH